MIKTVEIRKHEYIDGADFIQSKDWDGCIIRLSRKTFMNNSESKTLDIVGVYVIYADHYDRVKHGNEIYIGQGDDIRQRLKEHNNSKHYWNKVLIFSSKKMNIAIAYNIEKKFISYSKNANKYSVMNRDNGQRKKLGIEDEMYLNEYITNALTVLKLAGIDIFTINIDGIFSYKSYSKGKISVTLVEDTIKQLKVIKGSIVTKTDGLERKLSEENINIIENKIHFLEDVIVKVDNGGYRKKILGISLLLLSNSCGVNLSRVIEELTLKGKK
ncbi:MAG: hypothetical protein QM493_01800 [Sulfurovum sp.]